MRMKACATQLFYQKNKLITVKSGALNRAVFRVGNHALAEYGVGSTQTTNLLATDEARSVLQVKNAISTEQHAYSAYGHTPDLPSDMTQLGFTGEYFDKTAKSYLLGLGYRTYSTKIMRFLSPDSMSPFNAGGLNAYGYCIGDPVNLTDPTGHMPAPQAKGPWHYQKKLLRIDQKIRKNLKHGKELEAIYERGKSIERKHLEQHGKSPVSATLSRMENHADKLDNALDTLIKKRERAVELFNNAKLAYAPSAPRLSIISIEPSAPSYNEVFNIAPDGIPFFKYPILPTSKQYRTFLPSVPLPSQSIVDVRRR
ncbi:RHS repeat-associated core domain-containing protein [Pseudomonas sp. LLC-1]|uniref:RHS repeat-associated core domain-containing protein n=1 Tax=Pseudomonas sp. LLC-1 TaxID=1812180 RepID=UPI000D01782A|nr:RHS repeat-associated core domain-containing protein [Pseudomonas sp. LLC-1]